MGEQRRLQAVPLIQKIEELLATGRDEEAARVAARLVGILPDSPGPYLVWARLAESKGLIDNAIQNLEHALVRSTWGRETIARRVAELRTAPPAGIADAHVEEIAS
jgi:hypothetical protein